MRNAMLVVVGATLLGGCYAKPEQFNEKFLELYCEAAANCDVDCDMEIPLTGMSTRDAVAESLEKSAEHCDYDPKAARQCIAELKREVKDGDCSEEEDPDDEGPCDDVYTGDECA